MNSRIAQIISEIKPYVKFGFAQCFIPDFHEHSELLKLSDTLNDVDAALSGYDVDKYGVEQVPLGTPDLPVQQLFDNVISKELDENELAFIARQEEDNLREEQLKDKSDKSD